MLEIQIRHCITHNYSQQELLAIREHLIHLRFLVESVTHFSSFLFCPIICLYVLSSVLWCPLRFPCSVRLGLQLFVGRLMSWLRYSCLLAFLFCFPRHVYSMLPVSLDWLFWLPFQCSLTFISYGHWLHYIS